MVYNSQILVEIENACVAKDMIINHWHETGAAQLMMRVKFEIYWMKLYANDVPLNKQLVSN